jgi:cytochrome c peroxidase
MKSAGPRRWSGSQPLIIALSLGLPFGNFGCATDDPLPELREAEQGLHRGVQEFENDEGTLRTLTTQGRLDLTNPFFQSFGTNGRTCNSCHLARNGWGISLESINDLFDSSDGTHPIFRTVDGTNSPSADVSTLAARRASYSMLLRRGVIRIGLPMPANAEFDLIAVDDPYHHASAQELSLFRRPPPIANLRFQATIMIDGRETFPGLTIPEDLAHQANGATRGHAQATADLTEEQQRQLVDFELSLFSAQVQDKDAGNLAAAGATGGPEALIAEPFYIGINDPFPGGDPTGKPFDPHVFNTYDSWEKFASRRHGTAGARGAVSRGQDLFNNRTIHLVGVKGVNDELGVEDFAGSCTTCHDTPNSGNHSKSGPVDLGLTTEALRQPDEPLYTFRNKTTGEVVKTTDPGRGLITGVWRHLGRMKAPSMRSLAARAPYFHNGSAATLLDVVNFYDTRFNIGLTAGEKADLVAFLKTL